MSTFYQDAREKDEEEIRGKMLASAMSSHGRLGRHSSLRTMSPDLLRMIGQHVSSPRLPQLQIVDGAIRAGEPGIFAENFNPHQPEQIDQSLLLRITVSLPGYESETIFSGHVLPNVQYGCLHINSPLSRKKSYHSCLIQRETNGSIVVSTSYHAGDTCYEYGNQCQSISSENRYIRQETPQGFCVEVGCVAHWGQERAPVLRIPAAWPRVDESMVFRYGVFLYVNPFPPNADPRFVFTVLVANEVVLERPIVDPESPLHTIGCKIESESGGLRITGGVKYLTEDGMNSLQLAVRLHTILGDTVTMGDSGFQRLYLDGPEPQHRMQQDLFGGYISFRVERVS